MALDAELEKTLRRDCMEYSAAYRETTRLQAAQPYLQQVYFECGDALRHSVQREKDADTAIQYRLESLSDEDYDLGRDIIKSYMSDITDLPSREEVVKVVWRNQLGGEASGSTSDTSQVEESVAPEATQ